MQNIWNFLLEHDHYYIATHVSPDGDALGSAFGLLYTLRQTGKTACVVLGEELPTDFSYLGDEYQITPEIPQDAVLIALDCGDRARIAGVDPMREIDLSIDHHQSREDFARLFYVDAAAAATAEILAELFDGAGVELTRQAATCLYTGIATDTGCFKYSNASAKTHRYAAKLMETGVDAFAVNKLMFDTKTLPALQAQAFCIEKLEFYAGGKLSLICVSRQERDDRQLSENELDGLSALPRSVKGVEVGALLWEKDDGSIKVSLRGNGGCDVGAIAKQFSGGGHRNASGFTSSEPLSTVREMLTAALEERLA